MVKIQMTEREKEIVTELNHELYTAEYLEHWLNRNDSVALNASAALQAMGAHGFYEAVKRMAAGSSHSGEWIPCSERMPKNEEEVEITYIRKHYRTDETLYLTGRAFYTDGIMQPRIVLFVGMNATYGSMTKKKTHISFRKVGGNTFLLVRKLQL